MAEARDRGLHEHIFEIQLHLRAMHDLKSGGGHKIYVRGREGEGGLLSMATLDWSNPRDDLGTFDLIVGSDCIYAGLGPKP